MQSAVSARALDDYFLEVAFDDGVSGAISLKDRLFGPMFEPLRDPALFGQVLVDEFGAVCWPNGADIAPDELYRRIRAELPAMNATNGRLQSRASFAVGGTAEPIAENSEPKKNGDESQTTRNHVAMTPLVSLDRLCVKLDGTSVLKNVNAEIAQGKITALVGLNGSGKTTMLRAILREIPSEGRIRFHCHHDHRVPQPQHVGYVPQRLRLETNFPLTVRDLLAGALSRRPLFLGVSRALEQGLGQMLDRVGAPRFLLERPMDKISGGEQQRVLLALALEPNPELLLLDEPAAGIDFKDQVGFYDLIQRINAEKGVTILLASHDTTMVAKQAHHVLCLKDGHIECQGPPESTLTDETLAQIFGPQSALFRHHHH
jgi:zinc transport system ATP-binding protein